MATRSRNPSGWAMRRRQQPSYNDPFSQSMLAAGRRPDPAGNWKTTPGASPAWQDAWEPMPGDNMGGGLTPSSTWNNFFVSHRNDGKSLGTLGVTPQSAKNDIGPMLAPETPSTAADLVPDWAQPSGWNPDPSNPSSYTQAVAGQATQYFNDAGAPIPADVPGSFNANLYNSPFGAMPDLAEEDMLGDYGLDF